MTVFLRFMISSLLFLLPSMVAKNATLRACKKLSCLNITLDISLCRPVGRRASRNNDRANRSVVSLIVNLQDTESKVRNQPNDKN